MNKNMIDQEYVKDDIQMAFEEAMGGQSVVNESVSRRDFLKGTGVLVISFSLAGAMKFADTIPGVLAQGGAPRPIDSYIIIAEDGSVTLLTGKVELGTGIRVGFKQCLAEELDVAYERVTIIMGDTALCPNDGGTFGSASISGTSPLIRRAGAGARQFLLQLASQRLGVPVEQLTVNNGVVSVINDPYQSVTYGELIGGRRFDINIPAANEIQLKRPDQFKVIGQPIPRPDIAAKLFGTSFVQSVRVPGMVHGRMVLPPTARAQVVRVDESSVNGMPGLIKVVVKNNFVAVVCQREEQAIAAQEALARNVTWTEPEAHFPEMEDLYAFMARTEPATTGNLGAARGDVDAGLAAAARTFEAEYHWPFQMAASMSPMCAVADVRADGTATIWSGTQAPLTERGYVVNYLRQELGDPNLPATNVRVIYTETAGIYGRNGFSDDVSLAAAVLSREVGRPVRVVWRREDEHHWSPKGPPHRNIARAGVDAQGTITAWFFEDRTLPWRNTQPLAALLMNRQDDPGTAGQNGSGCAGQDYAFANYRGVSLRLPWPNKQDTGLRTNNLRAPGDPGRAFASESFLDEIASALGADPVQFRLRHITDQRMIDVINAAAGRAGRQTRPSPRTDVPRTGVVTGQGFAFARRNTYVAAAAEVEVDQDTGQVRVTRLVVAHDCGLIINPDSVLQQVETQVVQTVGRTLHEEVVFDQFSVTSQDWLSYPYLKPAEVPDVEVILINRPELNPSGVGEPACNPIPPAIANAIFDATGVRLREVPFTQARVKKALDERA